MKNSFIRTRRILKILCLAVVVSAAGFTGCWGPLTPLRETPVAQGKGSVAISIGGGTNGAPARTIAPDTGNFTKYTLSFSGPGTHDPIELNGSNSATVELSPGPWTIVALGYAGTAAVAEGSAQVNVEAGATAPAAIVLGPNSTAAGTGSFGYSITLPAGASGSLYITTAEGGELAGGIIALTAGAANTGPRELAPGQYLARLRLEKNGAYAGFVEALHIYAGLTSALSPRVYTDSDFPEAPDQIADQVMAPLTGVWHSHFSGIGRLDGYRIGRWKDFDALMGAAKLNLFPSLQRFTYTSQTGSNIPGEDDFFVFYDDTVYGQSDDGTGGDGSLEITMRYIGIVRAVNIFDGNPGRGAIIVEFLQGCAPQWDDDIKDGQRPFFGIYYIKIDADTVQMANPVDLDAMDRGEKYYAETATLQEAVDKNTAANESKFIAWGVVIPQEREP